jgi:hypothetical protein
LGCGGPARGVHQHHARGTAAPVPPFLGTAVGQYSASGEFADQGSIVAQFVLPRHPPNSTQIVSYRTLTGREGKLRLECSEVSLPASPVATQGSCAVLSASGLYAELVRRGEPTGVIVPPDTLKDMIVF